MIHLDSKVRNIEIQFKMYTETQLWRLQIDTTGQNYRNEKFILTLLLFYLFIYYTFDGWCFISPFLVDIDIAIICSVQSTFLYI